MKGNLVFKCQHSTAPNAAVVANSEENNVDDSINFSFNSLCFSVTFSCSAAGEGIHPDLSGWLYNQRCPTGLLFSPKNQGLWLARERGVPINVLLKLIQMTVKMY